MKHSLSQNTLFVLLTLVVLAISVVFYFTFTSEYIWNIATDGFTHTDKRPLYMQPWAWTSLMAAVIMFVFLITQGGDPNKMEPDSEEGTTHE